MEKVIFSQAQSRGKADQRRIKIGEKKLDSIVLNCGWGATARIPGELPDNTNRPHLQGF